MKLLLYSNPGLSVYCHEVKEFNEQLHKKLDDMLVIMDEHKGMGLSSNQVGLEDRMFIMRDLKGKLWEFINPEIIHEYDVQFADEACLSFPGITIQVQRPKQVSVKAKNRTGEEFHIIAVDKEAQCIDHEIQHLNGLTFLEGLTRQGRRDIARQIKKLKNEKI